MNITPFDIYLWRQADQLSFIAGAVGVLALFPSLITGVLYLFARADGEDDSITSMLFKTSKASSVITAVAFFIYSFIPSSKTIALMYVIPNIAKSDVIQKDLPEIYQMAKEALKDYAKTDK